MASPKGTAPGLKFYNKITFSGHKAPVTYLSLNATHTLMASSSEDQTIRIWDLAAKKCCKICLPSKEHFTIPSSDPKSSEIETSTEIASLAFISDHFLVAGVGSRLLVFNIGSEEVLVRQTTCHLDLEAGEINSIDLVAYDAQSTVFAILCACDSGIVVVDIDIANPTHLTKRRKLEKIHSAFISSAKWTKGHINSASEFISGGFDCKLNVVAWTGGESEQVKTIDLNTQEAQTSGNVKQMFNPPYVHCLAVSPSSPWAVGTTGSGNLEFLHLERFLRADPTEIHASSANVVCFSRVTSLGEILVSSGNDGILAVRSFVPPVESEVAKYAEIRTRQRELETRVATSKKPMSKPQQKLWSNFATQISQLNGVPKTSLLLQTKLSNNANWIVASEYVTASGNVFIADTTNDIICLTLSS